MHFSQQALGGGGVPGNLETIVATPLATPYRYHLYCHCYWGVGIRSMVQFVDREVFVGRGNRMFKHAADMHSQGKSSYFARKST